MGLALRLPRVEGYLRIWGRSKSCRAFVSDVTLLGFRTLRDCIRGSTKAPILLYMTQTLYR